VTSLPTNGRRAQPSGGDSVEVEPVTIEGDAPESGDSSEAVESNKVADRDQESRRMARAEKRRRPRAPLAEKIAAPRDSATDSSVELPEGSPVATDASIGEAHALVTNLSGEKQRRGARTAKRARSKQETAAAAMEGANDHPALGALNRHLNMMVHQLETAHRVIGRVAAERDDFRQQLADLKGIPVEAIAVTSTGQTEGRRSRGTDSEEPSPPSVIARLNYFSVEDIAVARRRRQTFVLGLLLVVLIVGMASRLGAVQMPDKVSRDSLASIPFIGDFISIMLAGWLFYRVIKVSSKGVKWVFPREDQRRRRR
jgi:hypothetical protein